MIIKLLLLLVAMAMVFKGFAMITRLSYLVVVGFILLAGVITPLSFILAVKYG